MNMMMISGLMVSNYGIRLSYVICRFRINPPWLSSLTVFHICSKLITTRSAVAKMLKRCDEKSLLVNDLWDKTPTPYAITYVDSFKVVPPSFEHVGACTWIASNVTSDKCSERGWIKRTTQIKYYFANGFNWKRKINKKNKRNDTFEE